MDWDRLAEHIASGVVNRVEHPALPLVLYNYTPRCQFERVWDDVTMRCRGLVVDESGNVVARPFRKFFNEGERPDDAIPWHEPSEITEKLDGSLLIVFHAAGEWRCCTRGSFTSPQSERGQVILNRYGTATLNPANTYLFEVIYPENRIVVDYGDREEIVLLAVIHTASGEEVGRGEHHPWPLVRTLPINTDPRKLREIIRDDEEGYVIRFQSGFRIKVKGARYMELHRLISGVSSRSIWESLSGNISLDDMLAVIPDEFAEWVKRERAAQIAAFDALNQRTEAAYVAVKDLPDRKSKALRILADFSDVSGAAFAAIDGRPTASLLWKQIYPEHRRPAAAGRIDG